MSTRILTPESDSESRTRFTSAKTRGSIPFHNPGLHAFLVCATLDPETLVILPADPVEVELDGKRIVHRPDIAVVRSVSGLHVIDVRPRIEGRRELFREVAKAVEARGQRYEFRPGGAGVGQVLRAEMVWQCRDYWVGAGDQFRVLHALQGGPLPLCEVEKAIWNAPDARAAIFALACHNVVELDLLVAPVTDDTLVRRRRPPP